MESGDGAHVGRLEAVVLELLEKSVFVRDPINEKHPIEVINLVLNTAGHQAIGFHRARATHLIAKTHLHCGGSHHIEINPRDTQATFFVGVKPCTGGNDLGVDQHQGWCARGLRIEIDHQQLLVDAHLGSGKAYAMGRVHAAQHVSGKIPHRFINFADTTAFDPESFSTKLVNVKRRRIQRLLRHGH